MEQGYTFDEKVLLRRLAETYAELAAESENMERRRLWTRMNDLQPVRPMVYINELPWNELNIGGALDQTCLSPWARQQERWFKHHIFLWKHLPGDMVLSDHLPSAKVFRSTGFGIKEDVDIKKTDEDNSVVSRHFKPQIVEEEDLEKIRPAVVTYDREITFRHLIWAEEVFKDILPVRLTGIKHQWYTPWDTLVRWTGIEEAMMDLYDRLDFIHEAVERIVVSCMEEMRQFRELELLDTGADNTRVGSGGYGYCSSLPLGMEGPVTPDRVWGCSNAQIFSEVSPDMHWDFALRHDLPWLEQFGLNYYGCCEPLHQKIAILRRIPNLRKVSVSPWCNAEKMAEELGDEVVLSVKPNPAVFATDVWNPDKARSDIRALLEKTRGCSVELVMKDVSTVRRDPIRLFEWAKIARQEVEAMA